MKDFKLKRRFEEAAEIWDRPLRYIFVEWQAVFNAERVGRLVIVNLGTTSKSAAKHVAQRKLRELLGKDKVKRV